MTGQRARSAAKRHRRLLIAAAAVVVSIAIVVPMAAALLQTLVSPANGAEQRMTEPTTTAEPVYTIKPLAVRPVLAAEGILPEDCPPPEPAAPDAEVRLCDVTRGGLYTLGPEALRLQLVRVDALLSPITNGYIVQVGLNDESARAFAEYTGTQVDRQIAFVRAGLVVSAPKITEPITGDTLQLSGELTEEQSDEMARLLRDET
jgi:hypothetical protein